MAKAIKIIYRLCFDRVFLIGTQWLLDGEPKNGAKTKTNKKDC